MTSLAIRKAPATMTAVIGGAAALSLLVGVLVVRMPLPAVILVGLPIALVIVVRPGAGFLLAIAVVVLVPQSVGHSWLVPPLLAGAGVVATRARFRLVATDWFFVLWFLWVGVSWWVHPELLITKKQFIVTAVAPLFFYVWARLSLEGSMIRRVLWTLLAVGVGGAGTVLLEFAVGRVIFSNALTYQWVGGNGLLFRPGGVFGGSPAAAVSLAMISLATLGLLRTHRRRLVVGCQAVIWVAIIVTYGRAGWAGLFAGCLVAAILLPYRRWTRVIYIAAVVSVAGYFVMPYAARSHTYQAGVVRSQSTSSRQTFLNVALPLAVDTKTHFLFGRGYYAFDSPTGQHDPHFTSINPTLWLVQGGPHDDYVRALLEQGVIGLLLLLGWLGSALRAGLRVTLRLPAGSDERFLVGTLTAAVVSFCVASLFHDLSHSVPNLTIASLMVGMLVTVARSEAPQL